MKQFLLLITFFTFAAQAAFAQNYGFRIYSDNGEKFEVFANSKRKTPQAADEVTVFGFRKSVVYVHVDLQRSGFEDIDEAMNLRDGYISRYKLVTRGRKIAELVFEGYENFPDEEDDNTTSIVTIRENNQTTVYPPQQNHYRPYKEKRENASCRPVDDAAFNLVMENLKKAGTDSERLSRAKNIMADNMLSSAQVKQMLGLFTFDHNRLEMAKYAYHFVYDKGMFFQVNDAFTFRTSAMEMDEYIKQTR